MIHYFPRHIEKCELPSKFTFPFCYTPHPLCKEAAKLVQNEIVGLTELKEELDKGKMFGVLIVEYEGKVGFLAAFSGNIGKVNKHPYFVPPIFDLLDPNGFFKIEERNITEINKKIKSIQKSEAYLSLLSALKSIRKEASLELKAAKEENSRRKKLRQEKRAKGVSEKENDELIKESQFLKAELKRTERKWQEKIEKLETDISKINAEIEGLKLERKQRSAMLQDEIFEKYELYNAKGEHKNIVEIFNEYTDRIAPAGTGECAAPKLLQYAFLHNMKPLAMAEFWWGKSPIKEIRHSGLFYPSCTHKCKPLLTFMLEGLEVEPNPLINNEKEWENKVELVYEDEYLMVVNKPEGLLSVPGNESEVSVYSIINKRFSGLTGPLVVHRLDMATSGLMIIAKNETIFSALQNLFETRQVKKKYMAILSGIVKPLESNIISLPLCPNIYDRPRQMVSEDYGKEAVTKYEIVNYENNHTRVYFYPLTGRTHQLRVHSAHPKGLNMPILGDNLYGTPADRLYLQAIGIEFEHPITHKIMKFELKPDF